ncbi:MAG: GntR family transcriptional regulator [Pseudomonadota bacterium]
MNVNKPLNTQAAHSDEIVLIRAISADPYETRTLRPIWLQIYDRLAEACASGSLCPGTRLPGENHLAEMFSVSRLTMRKALSKLQQEGQLQARKGVGIFVRRYPTRYRVEDNLRFAESLKGGEGCIETLTLELSRRAASPEAARIFGSGRATQVVFLKRLRVVDGEPIYLTYKEFPANRFPEFECVYNNNQSVSEVYRAHDISRYARAETRVTGGFASRQDSQTLQLSDRTPLIQVSSTNCDPNGTPIEFTLGRWPLGSVELVFDRVSLEAQV